MTTLFGDFTFEPDARAAMDALAAAGVPRERMRHWNVFPDSSGGGDSSSAIPAGAVTGAALAGVSGLVAGSIVGAAFNSASGGEHHLPPPNGVRVVVDSGQMPDEEVRRILSESGASQTGTQNAG